jgi:hypothetical protein
LNREGKEWSALHYAAFAGHAEVVSYLLEHGADLNALSTNGSTPLMMAAREGKEAIAKAFLAAGARTDVVNDRGEDAMRWAMRYGNLNIAREIVGTEKFAAAAAAQAAAARERAVRSQPVPDRADLMLTQARRLAAEGQRDEALKLYRAALEAIRQADAASSKSAASTRAVSGMVISAQRAKPGAQSAALNYATPAVAIESGAASSATDIADDWMRRARELEATGRRAEALQAYRQAAAALRGAGQRSSARDKP